MKDTQAGAAQPSPSAASRLEFLPDTLYVSGIPLSFADIGQGPTVILLHSAGASHRQWLSLMSVLEPNYRVIVPDLPGHGGTPELPQGSRRDALAHLVQALSEMAGGPFHLIGHSVGASIAMQGALDWQDRLLSLTLIEPVSFELLRHQGEMELWREIDHVASRHISLVRIGELEWAADFFMDYWIGMKAWKAMPPARRAAVCATMASVASGWEAVYAQQPQLGDYGHLAVPTLLMRGTGTTRPAHRVVDLLRRVLRRHELVEIAGAGHMSPLTHAPTVNAAILEHLRKHSPEDLPEVEPAVA